MNGAHCLPHADQITGHMGSSILLLKRHALTLGTTFHIRVGVVMPPGVHPSALNPCQIFSWGGINVSGSCTGTLPWLVWLPVGSQMVFCANDLVTVPLAATGVAGKPGGVEALKHIQVRTYLEACYPMHLAFYDRSASINVRKNECCRL